MKIQIALLLILSALNAQGFLFGDNKTWRDDLKVTWGLNPFTSFDSMPLTVNEAVKKGRKLEKGCDQVNGNRYILNGDRAVILVFDTSNNIAGIATSFPKNLPFNFPMQLQSDYMIEGDDSWTLTAFFSDPNTICLNDTKNIVRFNDKMVIKGDRASLDISRHEASLNKVFTESGCFPTMVSGVNPIVSWVFSFFFILIILVGSTLLGGCDRSSEWNDESRELLAILYALQSRSSERIRLCPECQLWKAIDMSIHRRVLWGTFLQMVFQLGLLIQPKQASYRPCMSFWIENLFSTFARL